MLLTTNRWKHFTAMVLIGDAVLALIHPQRDAKAWATGPRPWRKFMRTLSRHPALTRSIGVAQLAATVYWTMSDKDFE